MQSASTEIRPSPMARSWTATAVVGGACLLVSLAGCIAPWFKPRGDGSDQIQTRRQNIREKLESKERPRVVAQIGVPRMLTQSRLEHVGLVTGLANTGGKVNSSLPRDKMLEVMRREEADQPNTFLDSPATAMVVAHAAVPPAAKRGSVLDVGVKLSSHASATDLQRGWLMSTSLVEMSKLGGTVREGFEFAVAEGPLVTNEQIRGKDRPEDRLEGVIVGGARLLKPRELGIGINSEYAEAITMAAILPAINDRFTVFDGRNKVGIATPQKDSYISLAMPAKYELDPFHFLNVVLQIGFNESESQRAERIETLKREVTEPLTVRNASWQLEALGESSIPILVKNLDHPTREIRFYNAHTLAYLNDPRAIEPLKDLTRQEPAFRAMCLNALAIIDSYEAGDALEELLHIADAEARYGAVRALRHRDRTDPRVSGPVVGEVGAILEIPSAGPPLVVVSLHERPEVVIFGPNPTLKLPAFLYINPRIILRPEGEGGAVLSRFEAGKEDAIAQTSTDLRSVLAGIVDVGGTYGDWVSFLRVCSKEGYLTEPLAINPIPTAGRTYNREKTVNHDPGEHLYDETLPQSLDAAESKPATSIWYNPFTW